MCNQPIPLSRDLNWEGVFALPIHTVDEEMVDAKILEPTIFVRSEYFRQGILHSLSSCYTRKTIIEMLTKASHALPRGIHFMVLDCWRPVALQAELQRIIGEDLAKKYPELSPEEQKKILSLYVAKPSADPKKPSPHLTGGSVDLTLCDANGILLDMGGGFDEPSPISLTSALESNDSKARDNRRILYWAMINAGFTNLPTEWWHYDFGNQLWAYFSEKNYAIYSIAFPQLSCI